MTIETKASLEKRLLILENQIRELKNRLPAHSVKPGMMMELISLEDERDVVLNRIQIIGSQI